MLIAARHDAIDHHRSEDGQREREQPQHQRRGDDARDQAAVGQEAAEVRPHLALAGGRRDDVGVFPADLGEALRPKRAGLLGRLRCRTKEAISREHTAQRHAAEAGACLPKKLTARATAEVMSRALITHRGNPFLGAGVPWPAKRSKSD